MKKSIKAIFVLFCILNLCFDVSAKSKKKKNAEELEPVVETQIQMQVVEPKKLYKGEGLVIAVTSPNFSNASDNDSWIPQYFQDSLTGKFVQFSKMTVLDRKNESLIKAEQELSESGYYSENNIVQIGQFTNAQLVLVGNIQQISGDYEVNFRVNDATSNEIKASSNNRYSLIDMQSGKAVNETTQNLLEGLGIEFSDSEKAELSKVNQVKNSSIMNLAKGNAAEKSDDFMDALLFYMEAENDSSTSSEAKNSINKFFGTNFFSGEGIQNLKAQFEYANLQTERWNKIFAELSKYIAKNLTILVYDFSQSTATPNFSSQTVKFTVAPGLKIVPDRKVLLVVKRIKDEWDKIDDKEGKNAWTSNVKNGGYPSDPLYVKLKYSSGIRYFDFDVYLGFYDDTSYMLKEEVYRSGYFYSYYEGDFDFDNIKSQKAYFDAIKWKPVTETFKYDELPEQGDVTFKISRLLIRGYSFGGAYNREGTENIRIMSIDEYNEWAKNQ